MLGCYVPHVYLIESSHVLGCCDAVFSFGVADTNHINALMLLISKILAAPR